MKNIGHHACLREKEHLFRYQAYFEKNRLRFLRACAHVRAQMMQIACSVGMRNAIFMITAEIHVRSLACFYGQYAERHMNLKFMRHVRERACGRNCNSIISYRKKPGTKTN